MLKLSKYESEILGESTRYFLEKSKVTRFDGKFNNSKTKSLIKKVTEESELFRRIVEALQQMLDYSADCGSYLVQKKRVLKKAKVKNLEEIKMYDLKQCENLVDKLSFVQKSQHLSFGATTGVFGFIGLGADVLGTPALNNKTTLEMGMSYGFDSRETKLMSIGISLLELAESRKEKLELIAVLKKLKDQILKKAAEKSEKNLTELFVKTLIKNDSTAKLLLRFLEKVGINITEKSIGKLIPVISAFVSAGFSLREYNHLKLQYQHHFRLLWFREHGKISEEQYQRVLLGEKDKGIA